MDYGTPADYLTQRVERGREELAEARSLFERAKYRMSLSHSYYAVFHIVSATLFVTGIERTKHSGIEAAFVQHLVKPGTLEIEHGETFKLARKWREDADYTIGKEFTETTAREILERCERLFTRLETYLRDHSHLPPELSPGQTEESPK
ncbi:MAG: HEPN domain-containing protein [Chloroflexi bacterium]|nr:HEPN domain-containing protein [Chloroflexota bacterium]